MRNEYHRSDASPRVKGEAEAGLAPPGNGLAALDEGLAAPDIREPNDEQEQRGEEEDQCSGVRLCSWPS